MAQMNGAVSYCFWEICSKKEEKISTSLQGSTLSGPRMTTGFGPFELPTRINLNPIGPKSFTVSLYKVICSYCFSPNQ